jgi:DNA-binding NarL/FixJ family response regulator
VIRVGIVDDHPVVLDGLAASLAREPDIDVAWRVATLAEARRSVETDPCDVVLVDVRLPDGSGLDLIASSPSAAGPAFLVLSSFDRPQYARAAHQRGASGYLLKTAPMGEIVAALHIAASGGSTFHPQHLAALAGPAALTARELDLVRLVAEGWSNDEIATRLSLSRKTVEAYLSRLFERWGVVTRTELALRAEREGWLDATADAVRSSTGSTRSRPRDSDGGRGG